MKDNIRMCSGVFYDPQVQAQVLDVLRSKQHDVYKKLLGVAVDQEWYSIPFALKLDGNITAEDREYITQDEVELDVFLNIAKRYTYNGCNVDISLSMGATMGATCIPDTAFETLTGISLSCSEAHYKFVLTLAENADGVLTHTIVAEKVATAILADWKEETCKCGVTTEVPCLGTIVVDVKRIKETQPTTVGVPDKFQVEINCVNGDSSVMIGKSWFYRDEVA